MAVTVAIQGEQASFHDIAARQFFGRSVRIVACNSFADTFAQLKQPATTHALVAIENSLYGSINEIYDRLLSSGYWIMGEVYLHIEQCLIGLPDTNLTKIREVHSHPVALAQCENFLDQRLPHAKRFEHHDTAASVADIKGWNDSHKVAIASPAAAKLHKLAILAREIETHKENYTRFFVLSPKTVDNINANKSSLILTTDHRPGSLHRALGVFAKRQIDLTKLQSRPIIGQAWHYMFYADVLAAWDSQKLMNAVEELTGKVMKLRYSAATRQVNLENSSVAVY